MEPQEAKKLNSELLNAEDESAVKKSPDKPKRNSKEDLIIKIHKVVDNYALDFDYSDTRLKRMTKQDLLVLLAKQVEEGVKYDMAKSVGVDPRANGTTMSMGALRMVHNICASGFEKGFNAFGPQYVGYELNGFCESLQDPTMQQSIDECLAEIARESPEILEYFDSPWARLALVWTGAVLTCMRKKRDYYKHNHVTFMEPKAHRRSHPPGVSSGRSETVREVDRNLSPRVPNVRKV